MNEMTNYQAENKRQTIPEGLTMNGFDWYDVRRDETHSGNRLDLELLPEIQRVIVDHLFPIQTMNKRYSSYTLKHLVENNLGQYISNGQLIMGMLMEGYEMVRQDRSPNAYFNVSHKAVNELRRVNRERGARGGGR